MSGVVTDLRVIEDARRIRAAAKQLRGALRAASTRRFPKHWVGFPGGREQWDVYWLEDHGFFACFMDAENRFWNAFGTAVPDGHSTLPLTVEINMPYESVDRRIGAAFVEHASTDTVLVAHRGKIGGGRAGVSKTTAGGSPL